MKLFIAWAALVWAAPSELDEALAYATFGSRMPGETVSFDGLRQFDGHELRSERLPHKVRIVAFVEPLDTQAGVERLAWWKANAPALAKTADLIVVPSASPRSTADLSPLVVVDDPNCLLAARFGAVRLYGGKLGALPLAFVVDDSNIVRATIDVERASKQLSLIVQATQRLRQQLSEQAISF